MSVLVVNGPNLNTLGQREPAIYGSATLEQVEAGMRGHAGTIGLTLEFFQSNSEGAILDCIQQQGALAQGVVINPGALAHTSVALRDALSALSVPIVEVHISNVHAREPFRHHSHISSVVTGQIVGLGTHGYLLALDYLAKAIDLGGKQ